MNEHIRPAPLRTIRPATQAAEGVPRWRWTTAELLAMVDAGIFHPEERFELIEGEIVPMPTEGRRHATLADELAQCWYPRTLSGVAISIERQFNLSDATYTKPDLFVRPSTIKAYDLKGPDVLLVVEVADTSLAYDSGLKARIYAKFGVREYWVINAHTLETRVHRRPSASGYAEVSTVSGRTSL